MCPVRDNREDGASRPGLIALLGSVIAIGALAIDLYLPAMPTIRDAFATDDRRIQITLSVFLVGLALGQAVFGALSDRFGRRKPLVAGLMLFILSSMLAALAPNIELFIAARLFQGLSAAAVEVLPLAIVADLWSGRRAATAMSLLGQVMALSPIAAPAIGAFMLAHVGWRSAFWTLCAGATIIAACVLTFLPETLEPGHRARSGASLVLRDYIGLFRYRRFTLLVLCGACLFASTFTYLGSASLIFIDHFALSPQQFSLVFGLNAIGMITAGQANVLLLRRFPPDVILPRAIILHALCCLALITLVMTGQAMFWWIEALIFANFVCYGFLFGNLGSIIITAVPGRNGLAAGAYGIAGNIAGAFAGILAGSFADGTLFPPFAMISVAGFGSALAWLGRAGSRR